MALSVKTKRVLADADMTVEDAAALSDEDILAIPGVGPAVLADIRAAAGGGVTVTPVAPAPVAPVAPVAKPVTPPAPAPVAPAVAPPARCRCAGQPFRVTRTRHVRGKLERYCDACGVVR